MNKSSIQLVFHRTQDDLTGQSKWWGAPDLPPDSPYPVVHCQDGDDQWDEPLTFLCQIRCEDLTPFDPDGLLPHEGMLYFFAAIDYYLGMDSPLVNGYGAWPAPLVRVMYVPSCEHLEPYEMHYPDGTDVFFPAERLTFARCPERSDNYKLLGKPYLDEIFEQYGNCVNLLQVDENDDWGLRFVDCGMLCILMSAEDLRERRWNNAFGYLHFF